MLPYVCSSRRVAYPKHGPHVAHRGDLADGRAYVAFFPHRFSIPSIVAGFDVETSYWEPAYGFKQMDTHFRARLLCCENHQGQPGFAVFRLIVGTRAYMSEDPVSKQIRMHHGANNSAKPFAVHGISDESLGVGERVGERGWVGG